MFQYEATKHGEHVESKLANFRGTITVDAEHLMNGVYGEQVHEAGCNAHSRRKFRDAEATQPALALEGGRFLGAIYGEEESRAKGGPRRQRAARVAARADRTAEHGFRRLARGDAAKSLSSEPLAVAIMY